VGNQTRVKSVIRYVNILLKERNIREINFKAIGLSVGRLISAIEIIKVINPGLYQNNKIGTVCFQQKDSNSQILNEKLYPKLEITLSVDEPTDKGEGYQGKLSEDDRTNFLKLLHNRNVGPRSGGFRDRRGALGERSTRGRYVARRRGPGFRGSRRGNYRERGTRGRGFRSGRGTRGRGFGGGRDTRGRGFRGGRGFQGGRGFRGGRGTGVDRERTDSFSQREINDSFAQRSFSRGGRGTRGRGFRGRWVDRGGRGRGGERRERTDSFTHARGREFRGRWVDRGGRGRGGERRERTDSFTQSRGRGFRGNDRGARRNTGRGGYFSQIY